MADSQLLVILAVAMVAGVILFRLFTVLGRRTGNEREPPQPFQRIGGATPSADAADNKVVPLPGVAPRSVSAPDKPADPLTSALVDIKVADRTFEAEPFLAGARHAYELILTAFAANDRAALRPLLSDEVYSAFDGVIKGREERKEKVAFTFIGVKDARISHAALKGRTAEVTVTFNAQYISSTSSDKGVVIDGDPKSMRDAHDIWTFARDVRAKDPNWTLVATTYGEA
ncbi:MAG: Tim44/TimA family putative adaptor protein [Rhizomicrobium sp.]|jgi:predicted lipid-binding transport protein (Tim44 family)